MNEPLADKIALPSLSDLINIGNRFISIGFKFKDIFTGLSSNGDIMIKTTMQSSDGGKPLDVIQLYSILIGG